MSSKPLFRFQGIQYSVVIEFEGTKYKSFQLESRPYTGHDSDTPSLGEDTQLTVLDSVKSGTGRDNNNDLCNNVITPILSLLKLPFQLIRTTSAESVADFAKSLRHDRSHIIIILSGDTSISELLNNLPASSAAASTPKLAILPLAMGTGNAWASSLQLKCPVETFSMFLNSQLTSSKFPLYRAVFPNGRSIVFFIILSIGFHANLLHLCNEQRFERMGLERFQIASKEIFESYNLNYAVELPGILSGNFSYFAIINTPNLEPSYIPSPLSDPLKSQLHAIGYFSSLETPQLVECIMKGYSNKIGDTLGGDGVLYDAIDHDFRIVLNQDPINSTRTSFEMCCDGQLLNLLDLQSAGAPYDNRIQVEFLKSYTTFDLRVLSPKK